MFQPKSGFVKKLIDRSIEKAFSESLTTIGSGALKKCNILTSVSFPNVTLIESSGLSYCDSLKTVRFPNLTVAGLASLRSNKSLTTVEFDKIEELKAAAIRDCPALTKVIIRSQNVPILGSTNVFEGANSGLTIYVNADLVDSFKEATNWSTYSGKIKPLNEE